MLERRNGAARVENSLEFCYRGGRNSYNGQAPTRPAQWWASRAVIPSRCCKSFANRGLCTGSGIASAGRRSFGTRRAKSVCQPQHICCGDRPARATPSGQSLPGPYSKPLSDFSRSAAGSCGRDLTDRRPVPLKIVKLRPLDHGREAYLRFGSQPDLNLLECKLEPPPTRGDGSCPPHFRSASHHRWPDRALSKRAPSGLSSLECVVHRCLIEGTFGHAGNDLHPIGHFRLESPPLPRSRFLLSISENPIAPYLTSF